MGNPIDPHFRDVEVEALKLLTHRLRLGGREQLVQLALEGFQVGHGFVCCPPLLQERTERLPGTSIRTGLLGRDLRNSHGAPLQV
jgi:hypothetical protein